VIVIVNATMKVIANGHADVEKIFRMLDEKSRNVSAVVDGQQQTMGLRNADWRARREDIQYATKSMVVRIGNIMRSYFTVTMECLSLRSRHALTVLLASTVKPTAEELPNDAEERQRLPIRDQCSRDFRLEPTVGAPLRWWEAPN